MLEIPALATRRSPRTVKAGKEDLTVRLDRKVYLPPVERVGRELDDRVATAKAAVGLSVGAEARDAEALVAVVGAEHPNELIARHCNFAAEPFERLRLDQHDAAVAERPVDSPGAEQLTFFQPLHPNRAWRIHGPLPLLWV